MFKQVLSKSFLIQFENDWGKLGQVFADTIIIQSLLSSISYNANSTRCLRASWRRFPQTVLLLCPRLMMGHWRNTVRIPVGSIGTGFLSSPLSRCFKVLVTNSSWVLFLPPRFICNRLSRNFLSFRASDSKSASSSWNRSQRWIRDPFGFTTSTEKTQQKNQLSVLCLYHSTWLVQLCPNWKPAWTAWKDVQDTHSSFFPFYSQLTFMAGADELVS